MRAAFLDVHGVLLDFMGGLAKRWDTEFPRGEHVVLHRHLGISEQHLWCSVDNYDFWRELPPLESGRLLLRTMNTMCKDLNVPLYLLTKPMFHSLKGLEGTIHAVCHEFKVDFERIVITSDKAVCAHRAFLVDDQSDNCRRWREHQGVAFQWPCHYNNYTGGDEGRREYADTPAGCELALADMMTAFLGWWDQSANLA